jgi:hypothetical protein
MMRDLPIWIKGVLRNNIRSRCTLVCRKSDLDCDFIIKGYY